MADENETVATMLLESAKRDQLAVVANGKAALQGYATPTEWKSIAKRVAEMQTPEEAAAAAEDVTLLESLLKHAHQYGEKASEYCVLEARMYVRIASLYRGWSESERNEFLRTSDSKTKRLVFWVKDKSDGDLAFVLGQVAEGRRIEAVRRDELAVTRKMAKQDKYAVTAARLVDSFRNSGEATINIESFCDAFAGRGEVDAKTACVWIDQARKEVRKLGGVGLGEGDGRYVSMEADSEIQRRDVALAILNRLRSIERDMNRMGEICAAIGLEPPAKEVKAIIRAAEAMVAPIARKELSA